MKILLGTEKTAGHCLFLVDTDLGEISPIEIPEVIIGKIDFINYGILFNSSQIMLVGNDNKLKSEIIIGDANLFEFKSFSCTTTRGVNSIIPITSKKAYISNTETNEIKSIVFEDKKIEEFPYYLTDEGENQHLSSIFCNNGRWYASLFGKNYKECSENGSIVEITNKRTLYSDCIAPTGILIDSCGRLCFCESGTGKVVLGKQSIYLNGNPISIVEDITEGGYWVAVNSKDDPRLAFISYNCTYKYGISLYKHSSKCYHITKFRDL